MQMGTDSSRKRESANKVVICGVYERVSSFLERISFDHKAILGPF